MCLCIYQHIYTRKLHVWGFIFTNIYTKFTDVCTPSLHVCVYVLTYMCATSTCVCVYTCLYAHVRINACIHVCVCTCVYGYIYVCIYVCERTRGYIQMQCVCMQIYVYISGFVRVCVCVYIYTYMYEKTLCVHSQCVHTNTGIHVCVCILFTDVFYMCV